MEENFSKDTVPAIVEGVRAANDIPTNGTSFDYYNSFPEFRTIMHAQANKILFLIQRLIEYQQASGSVYSTDESNQFDSLVDVNDEILERIGRFLDEAEGRRTVSQLASTSTTTANNSASSSGKALSQAALKLLTKRNVTRPQLNWTVQPDNRRDSLFHPSLRFKPNALIPLRESLMVERTDQSTEEQQAPHPYAAELAAFEVPAWQMTSVTPTLPLPLEETSLMLVTTEQELRDMIDSLHCEKEIGVDLEHHDYRTYLGITCLMQISSRKSDYIVDALQLREHLYRLNEIFTDPKIMKVFHGSDMDLMWLQRDFSVYVVNLFDTHQASRLLGHPRHSLAYLVQRYCDVTLSKEYQMVDWRIRPLPVEMQLYARQDTHYLLYLSDRLRSDLMNTSSDGDSGARDTLRLTYERSLMLCQKRYEKPHFDGQNYRELYRKSRKVFNSRQLRCMERLFDWRDSVARLEDESCAFVLPNHMLIAICDVLPREYTGVLACCNPIPALVRKYVHEVHKMVVEARDEPLSTLLTPSSSPSVSRSSSVAQGGRLGMSAPHDRTLHSSQDEEMVSADRETARTQEILKRRGSLDNLFVSSSQDNPRNQQMRRWLDIMRGFVSPFDKYSIRNSEPWFVYGWGNADKVAGQDAPAAPVPPPPPSPPPLPAEPPLENIVTEPPPLPPSPPRESSSHHSDTLRTRKKGKKRTAEQGGEKLKKKRKSEESHKCLAQAAPTRPDPPEKPRFIDPFSPGGSGAGHGGVRGGHGRRGGHGDVRGGHGGVRGGHSGVRGGHGGVRGGHGGVRGGHGGVRGGHGGVRGGHGGMRGGHGGLRRGGGKHQKMHHSGRRGF